MSPGDLSLSSKTVYSVASWLFVRTKTRDLWFTSVNFLFIYDARLNNIEAIHCGDKVRKCVLTQSRDHVYYPGHSKGVKVE